MLTAGYGWGRAEVVPIGTSQRVNSLLESTMGKMTETYSKSMGGMSLTRRVSSVTLDDLVLVFLSGLLIVLPIAHTTSLRAFFLLGAASCWVFKMCLERKWSFRRTPLDIPFFVFFVTILLSFLFSLKLSVSLSDLRGEFLTQVLLFYTLVNCIKEDRQVKTLLTVLMGASFFLTLYGIVAYFSQGGELLKLTYRLGSLHQGYEAYAQYLIMVLPFNILALFYFTGYRERVVLLAIALSHSLALYLTHTRGAWLTFGVELPLIVLIAIRSWPGKTAAILIMIVVPFFMFNVLPSDVVWHGSKGISLREADIHLNTGTARIVMWKAAVEELAKNPFQGAGYGKGNFRRRFEGRPFAGMEQAHNTFINTAIQLGIQGLFALLFIIYAVLRDSWRGWKERQGEFSGYYHLGVFVMAIGFFTANQFAEFYIDDTALLFWLLVGLSVSLSAERRESAGTAP